MPVHAGRTTSKEANDARPDQQQSLLPYLQVAPLTLVLLLFFVVPLALVVVVSFFR